MPTTPKQKFLHQKKNAKQRGIEWCLTFEQWMAFWGDDLENRGLRAWNLGMQRPCDAGPYAVGNIRKGTPKDNGRTRAAMHPKPCPSWVKTARAGYVEPEGGPDLGYASVWDRI